MQTNRWVRVKSVLDTLSTVSVITVALFLVRDFISADSAVAKIGAPLAEPVQGVSVPVEFLTKRAGSAPIVILEFADFECPYCGRHAREALPDVRQKLVDTNEISYAFLHYPLTGIHRNAFSASQAAECAAREGKYWEMHAALFRQGASLTRAALPGHARAAGLDMNTFTTCLDEESSASIVNRDMDYGNQLGVTGTPTFLIGKIDSSNHLQLVERLRGSIGVETIRQAIQRIGASNGVLSFFRQ